MAVCLVVPVELAVSGFAFGSDGYYFYIFGKARSLMYHKIPVKGGGVVEMSKMSQI